MEERIKQYLLNQKCVLWGRSFDIKSKEGFKQAREFILDIIIDLEIDNRVDNEE